MIPGLTLHIHDDNCCGLSGSYGFKTKFEDNATQLGRIAGEAILERNPDLLISDCGACRMQLKHFTQLSTMDPTELLRLSLMEER
jgi:glycerol-3-phosphate dehydrogenase subunit C